MMHCSGELQFKKIAKIVFFLVIAIFLCRMTNGYFTIPLVLLAVLWGMTGKISNCLTCYAVFPLMIVLNGIILPKAGITGTVLRVAPLILSVVLFISSISRRGTISLPLNLLMPYLALISVTSMQGFAPQVSVLKVLNFFIFLVGIWFGSRNLDKRPTELVDFRLNLVAVVVFIVIGSVCTIPFPSIGYSINLQDYYNQGGAEYANLIYRQMVRDGGVTLFSGLLNQSQALAPVASICAILIACDMFFVEKKWTLLQGTLICASCIITFMTRSRCGLFSLLVGFSMISFYGIRNVVVPPSVKRVIRRSIYTAVAMGLALGVAVEIKNQSISRWLRKTNEAEHDDRSMGEALTSSRMGLIESSMDEFRRSPMLGSGFQVNFETMDLHAKKGGLILSAPVEKGLLPLMVLGEGGIVGFIVFHFFVISFFVVCHRRRMIITNVMFIELLATNIGEATFFSPGGCGGMLWYLTMIGGSTLDAIVILRDKQCRFQYYNVSV